MKDEKNWPNFFIVGVAKAGTTTLYEYLKNTNGIHMSPVKEPRYFLSLKGEHKTRKIQITDETKYLKLFSKVKDEKVIGEASSGYLQDPTTSKLIHEKVPNAKIIIMLRDPVQRAFSSYLMKKTNGQERRTFHQVIEDYMKLGKHDGINVDRTISAGLYTSKVKRYVDTFGINNVKIVIFEEFIKDTFNQVKEVLNFLGINSEPPSNIGEVYNPYGEPKGKISEMMLSSDFVYKIGTKLFPQNIGWYLKKKLFQKDKEKPELSKEDGMFLQKFYQEDIDNLEKMLCRKLPWKWFNESQI